MPVRPRAASQREAVADLVSFSRAESVRPSSIVSRRRNPNSATGSGYSSVHLESSLRMPLLLVPERRGPLIEQLREILASQEEILGQQESEMTVTSQTIFLRNPGELHTCQRIFSEYYGGRRPVTNFVLQPPCCGAALALEAWAIGGEDVRIDHFGQNTLAVSYRGTRWIHCAGIQSEKRNGGVYGQTMSVLREMKAALENAGSGFDRVLRTWFYLGGITQSEQGIQCYKELNRARTDFYRDIEFHCSMPQPNIPQGIYPASTGIGMRGDNLVGSCVALDTQRADALLLPLENPQQTPAYAYHPRHSPQSPKFSRGVAMVLEKYVAIWLSGTASVVHSESRHSGNIVKQTEQTIQNIERLISADNFLFHGVSHPGARITDFAKIRVYLKRREDFHICKTICEERFGPVPAIYAVADVCRPELLVEIEGVAFSNRESRNSNGSAQRTEDFLMSD